MEKRTSAFLISCLRRIEMLCVNMRRTNANRARSVLRPRGMLSIRRRLKLNSELARAVIEQKKITCRKAQTTRYEM